MLHISMDPFHSFIDISIFYHYQHYCKMYIYILYIEIIIYYNIIIINIIAIKYHLHAMPHNIVYIYLCLPSKLVCVGYQHYFIGVSSCR